MNKIKKFFGTRIYARALKLIAASDYDAALAKLDGFDGRLSENAKASFLKGYLLGRLDRFAEANAAFDAFLLEHAGRMKSPADQAYLISYARYLQAEAAAKSGGAERQAPSAADVQALFDKASDDMREEFPFQAT